MLGFAFLAVALLTWAALRVRRRGAAGCKTGVALRTILAVVIGLGGWFLDALIALTLLPSVSLSDELLAILAVSVPVAIGMYLAWTRRDRDRATKAAGILAAGAGTLLGGWLGFAAASGILAFLTTVIGATAGGNVALLALEFGCAGSRSVARSPQPQHPIESSTDEIG